jgi:sugar phosphate isomerase/epimerase
MHRREILIGLPLLAAGSVMTPWIDYAQGQKTVAGPRAPLGIQFFTLSSIASGGWDQYSAAMETAKTIGFDSLELAGLSGYKPEVIRRRAEELGLGLHSLHMGNDQQRAFMAPGDVGVANAQDAVYTPLGVVQVARINLPLARDLGCEWGVIAASGHSNFTSVDNIRRLCDAFNTSNEVAHQVGLKLSYHMHAPDFETVEGRMPFEVMMENTDSSIRYQLDVCWALAGGMDPVQLINKYSARLVSFHLKDLTKDKKIATPGDGVIDFAGIYAASRKVSNPLFYLERDGAPGLNPVEEATRGYKYLHELGWGTGA